MLLKRSVNLRNHWHLKERWRRNWNICIMFYCVFQGKGNCTITSLGHKPVFSWRRNSQKVCTGTSISMWICLSVTKTTTPDWEGLASDAPERQTAHETAWGIPLSWGWGCRSSLCLMQRLCEKMTGLLSQFLLKCISEQKQLRSSLIYLQKYDFDGNFYDIGVFWEGPLFFQLAESIFQKITINC